MRVIAKLKEAGRIIFREVINMAGIILLEGESRLVLLYHAFVNYGIIVALLK